MYSLATLHLNTQTDGRTDRQTDRQTDTIMTTIADYSAWQYDRLKLNKFSDKHWCNL